MFKSGIRVLLTVLVAAVLAGGAVQAQKKGESLPVDSRHLTMLVKTSVIAVNQANLTNNYSVLRALAAPGFQDKNSVKDLEKIFASLRGANLDLSPVVLYEPTFLRGPEITSGGYLRLQGYFPTSPLRINFDLVFQPVGGEWKLYGVSLQPAKQSAPTPRLR